MRHLLRALPAPTEEEQTRVTGLLRGWLAPRLPGTIAAYHPLRGEIDVTSLFLTLPGWRWLLPRLHPDDELVFADAGAARERHRLGFEQPVAGTPEVPVSEIDYFLVPGLAFDGEGGRLGRGGGHFDRVLLQRRPSALAVGVVAPGRLMDAVPSDTQDSPVDWLITIDEVIDCRATRRRTRGWR